MGASTQDMVNQLLAQTTVAPQPSFAGIQAPPNPAQLQQLLAKLQQQQFLQQQSTPTPGPYGYLHDAGKSQMLNVGQQLGNAGGLASQLVQQQQPPQQGVAPAASGAGSPAAPGSPAAGQAQISQAIQQAKMLYAAQIKQGADPDQAKLTTLKYMASAGVPGADDKLAEAQTALLGNNFKKAESAKDNAQAAMDTASVPQKEIENQSKQWRTVSGDPANPNDPKPVIQVNGNGEVKVNQKQSLSTVMAAQNTTPDAMQAMLDFYHTNGTLPTGLSRSPALQAAFWDAEAKYKQQTGNTAAAAAANKAATTADTQSLTTTQKQLAQTSSYFQTMDKNISVARTLANQIDFGDLRALNAAEAAYLKGVSDPDYAKYNVFFDSVANEYAKIKSGSLGNAAVSDAARKEAFGVLAPLISAKGVNAAFDAVQQEGQNRVDSLSQQRDLLLQRIKSRAGGAPQATPDAAPPASGPSSGWGQATVTKQ